MSANWDIGTLFTHGGSRFRATAFLRLETYAVTGDGVDTEIFREILVEEGKDPDNMKRLVYCRPEEADVVFGAGVCGCVVRLSDVTPEGTVDWPAEVLATQRAAVMGRVGRVADVGYDTLVRLSR
jgi:hypothetical protein